MVHFIHGEHRVLSNIECEHLVDPSDDVCDHAVKENL